MSGNKTYLADKETLDGLYDDIGDSDDTDGGYGFGTISAKLNYIINYKLGEAGGGELETISILPSQSNTLTYNGQTQSPTWSNYDPNKLDIGGTLEAHNAGEYKAAFVPKVGYKWENADTIKNISWYIGGTEINLPTVTNTMTYNGSEQYPTRSGYDSSKMSIGGVTKATNAGTYTTTFLPLTGCVWSDGTSEMKSVQWSISKVQGAISVDKTEVTLKPSTTSSIINVTKVGDGQLTAVSSNTNVCTTSISGNQVTINYVDGGNATVIIGLSESNNYLSPQSININVTSISAVRYGVRINKSVADPYNRMEYIYDAVGMTPAYMDYNTGIFNYGSWEDVWFVKNNKPVMLNYDGTEAYELNPDDQTKKLDGTSSDITNVSFNGNAMSRIPLCYVYMYEDSNYEYIIVSNAQYDANYKPIAHTRGDGTVQQNVYLPMYNGYAYNNKLRSLSGVTPLVNATAGTEISYAVANGGTDGSGKWYTETWSQRTLINALLFIMGKSDNTQAVFGRGVCSTSAKINTGTLNNKGQFYGSNDSTTAVKVFFIENWWGNIYRRVAGLMEANGQVLYKMNGPYNVTGSGYSNGPTVTKSSGGYASKSTTGAYGRIPTEFNGSETTYLCDYGYHGGTGTYYACCGGSWSYGDICGASFVNLNYLLSDSSNALGAAPSFL